MCGAKGCKGRCQQVFNHSFLALSLSFSLFFSFLHCLFSSLLWVYLCIKFIGRNKHICVISRKFLTHLSLGSNAGDLHKTSSHTIALKMSFPRVCVCWSAAKVCDRQDLSSNNRRFGQPIDPLVTRRLTLSENIILITGLRHMYLRRKILIYASLV